MSEQKIDTCPCCGARHFKVLDPRGNLEYNETHWEYKDGDARVECFECGAIYSIATK